MKKLIKIGFVIVALFFIPEIIVYMFFREKYIIQDWYIWTQAVVSLIIMSYLFIKMEKENRDEKADFPHLGDDYVPFNE